MGIGGAIIGGLFAAAQKRKDRKDALKDQAEQWVRHRKASLKGGFNPLTTMGQNSGQLGAPGGGAPLASAEFLADAVNGFSDLVTGKTAVENQRAKLENDLLEIRLEQARSGVVASYTPPTAGRPGRGGPMLGRNATTMATVRDRIYGSVNGPSGPMPFSLPGGRSWLSGDRPVQAEPVSNITGTIQVENALTGGAVAVPGSDGEVMGIDELVTLAAFAGAGAVYNHATNLGGMVGQWWITRPAFNKDAADKWKKDSKVSTAWSGLDVGFGN